MTDWRNVTWLLHDAVRDNRGGCQVCHEAEYSPNVEAFSDTGKVICDVCWDSYCEERACG
jgi:predicted CXXCH cytochrome family protein